MVITEQMIEDCYNVISGVQHDNPPSDFGSYHNYFSTTLSWGVEKYIDIVDLPNTNEFQDQLMERVIDQCY